MTTYLVLAQQKFNPNCTGTATGRCMPFGFTNNDLKQNKFYGQPLYLATDMTHILYKGTKYNITLKSIRHSMAKHRTNAEAGTKNIVDAHFREYIYDIDIPQESYLTVVQVKDNNTYLHNKFEFDHVKFEGMRFELIL